MDPARPGGCAADVQKRSSNVIRIPTLRQTKDSQDRQPNDSFFRVARDDFFDPSGFIWPFADHQPGQIKIMITIKIKIRVERKGQKLRTVRQR